MNFEISKDDYKNGAQRRYKLELSLTGALGLGTVLFLGLVWVFIFGVLVGRGYQPEKAVPELAKIMPEASHKAEAGGGVIQPEELTFLNTLRDEPARKKPAQQNPAAPASKDADSEQPAASSVPAGAADASVAQKSQPKKAPKQVAAASQPASQESTPEPSAAPAVKPAPQPEPRQTATAEAPAPRPAEGVAAATAAEEEEIDQNRYDYVYQIASLSEPQAALRFRDKVRNLGLQSEVKVIRGDKKYWHRVVVQFQGRPIDTRDMKAKLKTLGVDKPLLRSKVPVS